MPDNSWAASILPSRIMRVNIFFGNIVSYKQKAPLRPGMGRVRGWPGATGLIEFWVSGTRLDPVMPAIGPRRALGRNRTDDQPLTRRLLCRLSYEGRRGGQRDLNP